MESFSRDYDTICDLGSLKFADNTEETTCTWTILDLINWPEGLDEIKSPTFEDSVSNKWCIGISKKSKILFMRLHLLSTQKHPSKKARVKMLLISKSETVWTSREKIVNFDGLEKTISCGSCEYLNLNRFFDNELKLQGELHIRNLLIEQRTNKKLYQETWNFTNQKCQGRKIINMEGIATSLLRPSSSTPSLAMTSCDLGSLKFFASIQKSVCTWTISDLKNWPKGLNEVKSAKFRDSASNEWCIGISKSTGMLIVRFHLLSSQYHKYLKAKIQALLICNNEIIWQCQEKNININGPEKMFLCGYFENCKLNALFDNKLKLQGVVRLRNVIIEQYGANKFH